MNASLIKEIEQKMQGIIDSGTDGAAPSGIRGLSKFRFR